MWLKKKMPRLCVCAGVYVSFGHLPMRTVSLQPIVYLDLPGMCIWLLVSRLLMGLLLFCFWATTQLLLVRVNFNILVGAQSSPV